jgi:hypothetical protein
MVDPASRMHSTDVFMSSAARMKGACNAKIASEHLNNVSRGCLSASTKSKSHTRTTMGAAAHPTRPHINHLAVKNFTANPID